MSIFRPHRLETLHQPVVQSAEAAHFVTQNCTEGAREKVVKKRTIPSFIEAVVKDILVVASFPEALELMVELLEQSGYSVRQAMTGAAALAQMFHQFAPVVVIDDDLPDFTGVDLSNHLKEAAEFVWGNKCITIAIRGDMVHDEVAGWAGTDHLILKPLNFDVFDALIADCCDARFLPISSRRLLQ